MKYLFEKRIKTASLLLGMLISLVVFSSCSDMLESDPSRLTSADEYSLTATGDSVYSIFGVFSKLQKVADSYVLMGELRGDLMDVDESSDMYLKQINDFEVSSDNKYVSIKNYYDIINNCNYIIQKLDTNLFDAGKKLQIREYAALKAIRAWTYLQIALNYQTAKYYTYPILTVADAQKTVQDLTLTELADSLIADLEPVKEVDMPQPGSVDAYNYYYSFIPVKLILGDLYLWRGSLNNSSTDYENAAYSYFDIIKKKYLVVYSGYSSAWSIENKAISSTITINWMNSLGLTNGEVLTTITCPTEYGQNYYLDTLSNQRKILPSSISINNWKNQTYYLNDASSTAGDLRQYGSIWYKDFSSNPIANTAFKPKTGTEPYIYKYKIYNQNVQLYRASMVYLRYAEAVNRLNKPNLAFAVLKYGVTPTNMNSNKIVPASEKGENLPKYMSFTESWLTSNSGIHMRGCGNSNNDTTYFRIPRLSALQDSVLYVEDKIQQELALETAYEGNRFQDLMRITMRRIKTGEGTEAYLADKVAAKHTDNKEAIRAKLMTIDNWFIKK